MTERKNHGEPAIVTRVLVSLMLAAICIGSLLWVAQDNHLITVVDGDEVVTLISTEDNEDALLDLAGVALGPCDATIRNESAYGNVTLEVDRADTCYITADGWTRSVTLLHGTVADALAKAHITLGEEDFCNCDTRLSVRDKMHITVHRVTHETRTETGIIPYTTKEVEVKKYYVGIRRTTQAGKNGAYEIVYDDTYLDGELYSTEKVSETVTKKAVQKIVAVGTKERPDVNAIGKTQNGTTENAKALMAGIEPTRDGGGSGNVPAAASWHATVGSDGTVIDHNGVQVFYQSMLSGTGTAYYSKRPSGTASGRTAQYGTVAVDPKVIPYGTLMYICSPDGRIVYGYAIAGDTGSTLRNGTVLVDLYYDNYGQCCWFGNRKMNVYIIG